MPSTPRLTSRVRAALGGLLTLLAAAALVVVPSSPASAVQTISWTTAPPATATVGSTMSFAWSGTANTFLGARITGCFATFSDGNNYTNSFGGNFTTGNCSYTNRVITTTPYYPVTVGFTLSTGGTMTISWNVSVSAPTPTVTTTGNQSVAATSVTGAPAFFSAYGSDAVYGTYSATCIPASGSVFPVGVSTVSCSATSAGGKTGTSSLQVTVTKGTPVLEWSPPSQVVAGTPVGAALLNATMARADATGTLSYADAGGNPVTAATSLPAGDNTVLTVTYVPSGAAASAYNEVTETRQVNVVRIPQSVAFGEVPTDATVDDGPVEVTAAGTSGGGAVTIGAVAGSACSVADHSAGTAGVATVTITGVGACVLEARQAQTATYLSAPVAQKSMTVARRTPIVAWSPTDAITFGDTLADLLDASTDVPGTWTYRLNGAAVDAATTPDAGLSQVLDVLFTPEDPSRYTTTTASRQLNVHQAAQHLDVAATGDRTYGEAPFEVDAASDGPGTITVTVTDPCSVIDRVVTPEAAGECDITVSQAGDGNHTAADDVIHTVMVHKATAVLTWDQPTDLTYGDAVGSDQLDATLDADVDPSAQAPVGDLTYTLQDGNPAEGAVLDAGDHVLQTRWDPLGDSADRWKPVTGSVTVHVAKALPTLSWSTPAAIVHGVAIDDDQLDATVTGVGSVAGDISYVLGDGTPARGTVLGAGTHTLQATFTPSGPGADNYKSASADVDLLVLKAPQTIDFTDPGTHTYGDAPFDLVASGGGSGRPVTFATDAGSACTVHDATVTITGVGECSVTAAQEGNDDFAPAVPVVRSLTVTKAVPTLAWSTPAAIVYGTPLGADQLDASVTPTGATGTVSYVLTDGVTPALGAVLHAGAGQTVTALFEPDQAAEGHFLPTSASVTIDVTQAPQVLTLAPLSDVTYGHPAVPLHATGGDSGAPVSYSAFGSCDLAGASLRLPHAGSCTVTATQAGTTDFEPAFPVSRSFTIAKSPLTVTARSSQRPYGSADNAWTYDLAGLVAGDTESVLAVPPTCTSAASPASHVGRVAVSCAGATAADYAVAYLEGAVTVVPAALTVDAPSGRRRYGQGNPAFAPQYSGFVNHENADDLTTPATCASSATKSSPAGRYPVTCTGAASADYTVTLQPGNLRIRYWLSGLAESLAGVEGRLGTIPANADVRVRVQLLGSKDRPVPHALAAPIGRSCRATLTVTSISESPLCLRYNRGTKQLEVRLDTHGLKPGTKVDVVFQATAVDGTVASRRSISVRVR